jgi:hypothetical protein
VFYAKVGNDLDGSMSYSKLRKLTATNFTWPDKLSPPLPMEWTEEDDAAAQKLREMFNL